MFIPRKREDLFTLALKVVDSSISINGPHLQCKPTAYIESTWAMSYHPLELEAKKTGVNMIILMQLAVP